MLDESNSNYLPADNQDVLCQLISKNTVGFPCLVLISPTHKGQAAQNRLQARCKACKSYSMYLHAGAAWFALNPCEAPLHCLHGVLQPVCCLGLCAITGSGSVPVNSTVASSEYLYRQAPLVNADSGAGTGKTCKTEIFCVIWYIARLLATAIVWMFAEVRLDHFTRWNLHSDSILAWNDKYCHVSAFDAVRLTARKFTWIHSEVSERYPHPRWKDYWPAHDSRLFLRFLCHVKH